MDTNSSRHLVRTIVLIGLSTAFLGSSACARQAVPQTQPATAGEESGAMHGKHDHDHAHHHDHDQDHETEHHGQGMNHAFDDPERWSKVFDNPERDVWQKPDEVVAALKLQPGMVVADLGAGTGYLLERLSRAVGPEGKVLALDVEPSLVEHMKVRAREAGLENVEPRVVDPADPGLAVGSVDRIVTVNTWHHIGDRPAYARRLAESLKPGGELHVVDFDLDAERGPDPQHRLSPEAVIAELAAGGFEAAAAAETLPDQYIIVGRTPK